MPDIKQIAEEVHKMTLDRVIEKLQNVEDGFELSLYDGYYIEADTIEDMIDEMEILKQHYERRAYDLEYFLNNPDDLMSELGYEEERDIYA